MKIKIIDLLNMISKGEEVPKKIKWEDIEYEYSECNKDYLKFPINNEEYQGLFNERDMVLTPYLNDEVEIIEEKKIEHYDMFDYFTGYDFTGTDKDLLNHLEVNFEHINEELKQIIDYINNKD